MLIKSLRLVKVAVLVLLLLAAASIVGTLIPQNADQQTYLKLYGPALSRVLSASGLTNVFTSWWFLTMVGWLTVSMIVCSIMRLPSLLKATRPGPLLLKDTEYKQAPFYKNSSWSRQNGPNADQLADITAAVLQGHHYRSIGRDRQQDESHHLSAQKGTIGRFGPLLVHLGIVIVVAGGALTAIRGFRQSLELVLGQATRIPGTPYLARLDDFQIEYYQGSDRPKEYLSRLSLLEDNRRIADGLVKVNSPLSLGGFSFYQMSYGPTVSDVTIAVTSRDDGRELGQFKLPMKQATHIEQLDMTLNPTDFLPDFALTADRVAVSRSDRFANPAVQLEILSGQQLKERLWLFADPSGFHHRQETDFIFRLKDFSPTTFNVLKVVRDPAIPLIFTGFGILVVGTFLSCYFFHRRVRVLIKPVGQRIELHAAGWCNKNALDFQREFDKLVGQILPPQGQNHHE